MEETRYIAAVDLGSSKIAICVASVDGENADMIYYKEAGSKGISRSSVQNVRQAGTVLKELVEDAQKSLGIKITQAVTGLPKYYIRQESCQEKCDRDEDQEITEEEIQNLMEIAKGNVKLENEESETIYGAVAQSYSDGEDFQIKDIDIIGRFSRVLEGNYKIFIGKKSSVANIDRVFNGAGISAIRKYFTADTTAKAVLDSPEMDNGVALVDFGAGAVSVSVYLGGIMRHYAAIPFGGKTITSDITNECAISGKLAENIKKAYGYCTPDDLQNLSEKELQIKSGSADPDKRISVKYLSEIINERMKEIINAVLYEIQKSGCAENLRNGLVVTGGGVELGGCCKLFHEISGYTARIGYPKPKFRTLCDGIRDTSASVCAGLILAAKKEHKLNCCAMSDNEGQAGPLKVEIEKTVVETASEPAADQGNGELFSDEQQQKKEDSRKPSGGSRTGRKTTRTETRKKPDTESYGLWDKLKQFAGEIIEPDNNDN